MYRERTTTHQWECAIPLGTAAGGGSWLSCQPQSVPGALRDEGCSSSYAVPSGKGLWSLQPTSWHKQRTSLVGCHYPPTSIGSAAVALLFFLGWDLPCKHKSLLRLS